MKLHHHLARFIPEDKEVLALKEDAVLAALEAFALVRRLQTTWSLEDGVVPPVKRPKKLFSSTWGRGDELASYLGMALEEGRAPGHGWPELVPEIAARIPPSGHAMAFFVLCACAYDPVSETVEQADLIEAFAGAFGEDRAACEAEVVEYYRDHFDYQRALVGLRERDGSAAPATTPSGARAALIEELERLGMTLPGTHEMDDAELERLPEVTVLAVFDDAASSAAVFLVPAPIITPTTRQALGLARTLCLSDPQDVESVAAWFAAVRLVTALGEDLTPNYDAYLGAYADRPGCPGREELAASLGIWSQYRCATFEDGSRATNRPCQGVGFNTRLTDLMLLNLAI